MDKVKLIQRLMTTFLEELDDHVRAFNRDLLILEKNPTAAARTECLKNLFRTAHSLKGAARSVNVTLIESACHRLEGILERVRDGALEPGPDLYQLLFCSVDGIEEAGMRLREQHDLSDAPLAALLPRLDAMSVLGEKTAPPKEPEPAPPPPAAAKQEQAVPSADLPPPAPAKPPEPLAGEPVTVIDASSVRVSAEKLDTLLGRIGELLVARRRVQSRVAELALLDEFVEHWEKEWRGIERLVDGLCGDERATPLVPRRAAVVLRNNGARLRRLKKDLDRLAVAMKSDSRSLDQAVSPLNDEVHAVRMLPFAEACAGLDRMLRDLAHAGGKEVGLVVAGGKVELDRSVLEGLKDPLRHLVRNAVDHGIEAPAARQQAGKNPRGRIVVTASLHGSQVDVAVQDDGRGLNLDALREQARRRRIGTTSGSAETVSLSDQDLVNLIFLPGLSTASIITDVSGRGVGLDVVKSRVESLHGTVTVASAPGQGVAFTLTVPLTLTTLRAVLVSAGGQTFAFAGTNVHKFVRVSPQDLRTVAGREMLILGGQPVPFAQLSAVLRTAGAGPQPAATEKMPVLIVTAGERRMAFGVDEFLAEQEILVKNLGPRIRRVPMVAGATLLVSGKIALVLNGANLVRAALGRSFAALPARSAEPAAVVRKRVLVAEDSVTTRTLEKSILEGAGYDVAAAVDGQAAWEYLRDHDVDLIVSDVEMPNMDGFELTRAVRASPKLRATPLVLVTARQTDQDRARGIEVGADAYLVKSGFDQRNLLETIAQLL